MTTVKTIQESMVRVARLASFYREHPGLTLDMLDSLTDVTIEDLQQVLAAAGWRVPTSPEALSVLEARHGKSEPYSDLNGFQERLDKAGFKTL